MKYAKIIIEINDYIIDKNGIIDNDILIVKENDDKIIYDIRDFVLTKINKESKITLDFNRKTIYYELINENQVFHTNFEILSLTNTPKQVIINYRIEETPFLLKIKYETI